MPQEFQVLRCCSCETFQVHQVKKVLKWECKLCGQKQSVIKVVFNTRCCAIFSFEGF